ncbi:MAG: aminotransferase class I/II-fold pyridoxal phosphate-dependent enzyme [Rhizomicrobium sp.]
MVRDGDGVTRRAWLGAVAAGGVALSAASEAASTPRPTAPARLSLNENPFGPSPLARRAILEQLDQADRYVGAEARALEEQIAAVEGVSADQIILGEILDALGLQLALDGGPGGEFLYSAPGYTALVDAVAPGGGVVVGVPLNDRLENDLPAIAADITARTRAIYLVNPHNPSGTVSETAAFKAFLRVAAAQTTVIVDEAYLEFEPDFADRTAAALTRAGANVIVFRTFAKIYGLAGLSIGYAVAPKPLAASLKNKGLGAPHALNRLALAAAAASLRDTGYIPAVRAKVIAERQAWNTLLDGLGVRRSDSRGNFVFFEAGRPYETFAAALLAEGIEIARPFPPLDRWVRIAIGLPDENARARAAVRRLLG